METPKKQHRSKEQEAAKRKGKGKDESNPRPRFSWRLARTAIQLSNDVDYGVCVLQHLLTLAEAPHKFFKAASGGPASSLSAAAAP